MAVHGMPSGRRGCWRRRRPRRAEIGSARLDRDRDRAGIWRRVAPRVAILLACLPIASFARADAAPTPRTEADTQWAERAKGVQEPPAPHAAVLSAYTAYDAARKASGDALVDVWTELRTAHFLIDFTDAPDPLRERIGREAAALADRIVDDLSGRAEDGAPYDLDDEAFEAWVESTGAARRDLALTYFWSGIVWGAHSQRLGLLAIVRQGVARRLHDYARIAIRLDPTIERGGSQRLLSRLHGDLPRVPFISGWVDRDRTVPYAQQAIAIDPNDPGNKLILALAWLDHDAPRAGEARALLAEVAAIEPRPELRVEDLSIRRDARERLAEIDDD